MKKTLLVSLFILGAILWHHQKNSEELETVSDDTEMSESDSGELGDQINVKPNGPKKKSAYIGKQNAKDLDRLGEVYNEFNSTLSKEELKEIKDQKKKFDLKEKLKTKTQELEKAYLAKNYSVSEIKKLQGDVVELKRKLDMEVDNIEKWDPKFVYYLIINDNYTLSEINQMKNLGEHGLSQDEIEYIKEYTQTGEFNERLTGFKENSEVVRKTASVPKEKDEFVDAPENETASLEDRLIEMDYNPEEKEEMSYGYNQ